MRVCACVVVHACQAYLPASEGRTWAFVVLVFLTLGVMMLWPRVKRVGKWVPASLVAIVLGTAVEW